MACMGDCDDSQWPEVSFWTKTMDIPVAFGQNFVVNQWCGFASCCPDEARYRHLINVGP